MGDALKPCWEILDCGREEGGRNVDELGECIASREGLGHSCWMIAGTLCGGTVQGTAAKKREGCTLCPVFRLYHGIVGRIAKRVKDLYPEEEAHRERILFNRLHGREIRDNER